MKKILSLLALAAFISLAACNNKKDDKAEENKTAAPADNKGMEMAAEKDHVCTDKCKDGTHVYAHGEKGHVCTAECHKM